MEKSSANFANKIPTYQCLECGKKNQKGNICPYCRGLAKWIGAEAPFEKP